MTPKDGPLEASTTSRPSFALALTRSPSRRSRRRRKIKIKTQTIELPGPLTYVLDDQEMPMPTSDLNDLRNVLDDLEGNQKRPELTDSLDYAQMAARN